mmetsp:Transcript_3155/g.7420  ORF Transcript_3155/g.7420 Transcript_3155/m.7420 type:complete len:276 (-) Transcript_3155:39-866(-)
MQRRAAHLTTLLAALDKRTQPVVVFASTGYGDALPYLANFFCQLGPQHVPPAGAADVATFVRTHILVLCIDTHCSQWCDRKNVTSVPMSLWGLPDYSLTWGMQQKYHFWLLVADLVALDYHVLFLDADVVWLRDPFTPLMRHVRRAGSVDMLAMNDGRMDAKGPVNAGVMFFVPSNRTRLMTQTIISTIGMFMLVNDQTMINQVLFNRRFQQYTWRTLPSTLVGSERSLDFDKALILHAVGAHKRQRLTALNLWSNDTACTLDVDKFIRKLPPKQ